jgi:hypothetical protein
VTPEEEEAARLARKRANARERQERYRLRHKAAGQELRASGNAPERPPPGSYSHNLSNAERLRTWRAEKLALTSNVDPGNRNFDENGKIKPGSKINRTHGGTDPERISAVSAQILTALLNSPDCPQWLHDTSYNWELLAWSEAEARVTLMRAWLNEHGIVRGMTEVTVSEEVETSSGDKSTVTRVLNAEKIDGMFNSLHKAETLAANRRAALGLTPVSRARLGKDLAASQFDLARFWAEEDARESRGDPPPSRQAP